MIRDAEFLEFIKVDDRHESDQISCVGCNIIVHRGYSNEEEKTEIVEVSPNTKHREKVDPVSEVIPADVDLVNFAIKIMCEETFKKTLHMSSPKCQVKPAGKTTYFLGATYRYK